MNPVGRFLRAVLPQGKQTTDLRPGTVIHATVERSLGGGHWLLRVGSQRFTAQSHIALQNNQSLRVYVEQSQQGLVFRVMKPSLGGQVFDRLLANLGYTDTSIPFSSVLESFVQAGLPLHEQLTAPALRQFERLMREFPSTRRRYRETARYIAMFTDRGLRVPDEMIVELIDSGSDRGTDSQSNNSSHNPPNQDDADESEQESDEPCLFLPDSESSNPGASAWLSSLQGRQDNWRIVPVAFGLSSVTATVHGELRMQMIQGEPHGIVLDVTAPQGRWVFCWNYTSDDSAQIYVSDITYDSVILYDLQQLLATMGLGSNAAICSIEHFNGFLAMRDEKGVVNVDAQG